MKLRSLVFVAAYSLALVGCGGNAGGNAPRRPRYQIDDRVAAPLTEVRDQANSGTCWAFGGVSLMESELLLRRGLRCDLSEMWLVRHAYLEKVMKYVRTRGNCRFRQGGELQDGLWLIDRYGIVPEEVYPGNASDGTYDHRKLARTMSRLAERIVDDELYATEDWIGLINKELDEYLGVVPESFEVDGHEFTPKTYAASLELRSSDFVAITSFAHHPFFSDFVLEIPDNWAGHRTHNLPLDSLMNLVDDLLQRGVSVGWNSDVSERSFRAGIGILPVDLEARKLPAEEIEIDQALRQELFDRQETTDDHIMHLVGVGYDKAGTMYYKVKNSWGTRSGYDGFWYVSPTYVAGKTIELLIPRKAFGE